MIYPTRTGPDTSRSANLAVWASLLGSHIDRRRSNSLLYAIPKQQAISISSIPLQLLLGEQRAHLPQPENESSTRKRASLGPARTLDIPVAQAKGSVFRMTSNTMDSELMQSVSEELQNLARERDGARPSPSWVDSL